MERKYKMSELVVEVCIDLDIDIDTSIYISVYIISEKAPAAQNTIY
jgi:hypothetical protein